MSRIHPEKVFGIGITAYEKVINYMGLPTKSTLDADTVHDQVIPKLSKKEKHKILALQKKDQKLDGSFYDAVTYQMKFFLDLIDKYPNKKINIYSVAKNFFDRVKTLRKDIPPHYINLNDEIIYLLLKDSQFSGAYVHSFDFSDAYDLEKPEDSDKAFVGIKIILTNKAYSLSRNPTFIFATADKLFNIDKVKVLKSTNLMGEQSNSLLIHSGDNPEKYYDLLMGIINTVLYINSKDPDIENLKPVNHYNRKALASIPQARRANLCTMPVKLLGWSFYGNNYNVDSTTVQQHLRWQPCGLNRSEVKLIWVKEHTRNYSKGVGNE